MADFRGGLGPQVLWLGVKLLSLLPDHALHRRSRLPLGQEGVRQLVLASGRSESVASLEAVGIWLREGPLSVYCVIIFTSYLRFDHLSAVQHFFNILYDFQLWYLLGPWHTDAKPLKNRLLPAQDSWLYFILMLLHDSSRGGVLVLRVLADVGWYVLLFIRFFITVIDTWS